METKKPFGLNETQVALLERIAQRSLAWTTHMIWEANHREDALPGDPKIGGHPASCASSLHLSTALQLVAREPADFYCAKPHLAPLDHGLHHAKGAFRHPDGRWFDEQEAQAVMHRLRSYSKDGEPVFQSYHADSDPDSWRTLPSGTVGIPPVNAAYLALSFRYAEDHGWATNIPKHFWCLIGDSELREGSLMEAMPDVAERELGNVTWIIDYNRQNLDGTRIPNQRGLQGTDADRIERMFAANGWEVIQLRHGSIRDQVFQTKGGDLYRAVLEESYSDYEYQALLWKQDGILIREDLLQREPKLKEFLNQVSDEDLVASFGDLGGHDMTKVLAAYEHARKDERVPVLIVAHTVKGWGLNCAAMPGNHSSLPSQEEVEALLTAEGIDPTSPYTFGDWESDGPERNWLTEKGTHWRLGIEQVEEKVEENRQRATQRMGDSLPLPTDFGIDLKLVPLAHTQWVWGQVAGKLIRVGTHDELEAAGQEAGRELTDFETQWAKVADLMVTMSPDVGTSTNINPAMDAKIYGPSCGINLEAELDLNERGRPELFQHQDPWTRHIRFEIAEANCMSAAGSFGKMGKFSGVPLLPMMTVYDFFIKRALDQLYYNVYWRSSFILIGTPSGVSLSPEGAQHSWKSDIQMPSLVTWEPSYAAEMEWILADAVDRHVQQDNEDREGVLIRAVTRGISQKEFTKRTKALPRFQDCDEATRLESLRQDVLHGGYKLVDKSQDSDYEPGENVVDLLVMGALAPEALEASDQLAEQGIQANVIVVTSADLLLGRFAERDGYTQLNQLGLTGDLQMVASGLSSEGAATIADTQVLAARFVPIVSIVDGEEGLLDNAGSVIGVPQVSLAVKKFSKSGRPEEIYRYHGLDADSISKAAVSALERAAERGVNFRS